MDGMGFAFDRSMVLLYILRFFLFYISLAFPFSSHPFKLSSFCAFFASFFSFLSSKFIGYSIYPFLALFCFLPIFGVEGGVLGSVGGGLNFV